MSEENVELARSMVGWFNARDVESAQAHSTDDVEIVPLRAAIEGTIYEGREAFAAFWADTDEAWEDIHFDVEAIREANDRVVAIGQLSARARLTGADVTTRLAMVYGFKGDQVSKLRTYMDVDEALEAAGLSE